MTLSATILIVDDEPFNVDYLEQELADLGYATLRAANGPAALDQVSAHHPDLVLLDIMMPGLDGFQVLEILKHHEQHRHIPVIIISANNDMASVVRGIGLGAEDYLPKPFEPILLEARINSSLERKALRDAEQKYTRYLAEELNVGRRIQLGFLPAELPTLPGWDIAARFQSAREVAGDFYDTFWVASINRLAFFLGDVCDKGVGSALYMALFRSLLRAATNLDTYARRPITTPVDPAQHLVAVVTLVNNYIAEVHGSANMFATLFFALLDTTTGDLHYVNAGHVPPLVFNPPHLVELDCTGPVVGIFPDLPFHTGHIRLDPGAQLLILSDGVTEAHNPTHELLDTAPITAALLAHPTATAAARLDHLLDLVATHAATAPQTDDITLLALHRLA